MKLIFIVVIMINLTTLVIAQDLTINEKEYFDSPAVSVLVFHNVYPVGMQGGIEIIQHHNRIATNGNVGYKLRQAPKAIPGVNVFHVPVPKIERPERIVDNAHQQIKVSFANSEPGLKYHILITAGKNGAFTMDVNFDNPVTAELFEEIAFEMMFYPEAYAGKSFMSENGFGQFPFDFISALDPQGERDQVTPLLRGKKIILAAEDPLIKMEIVSDASEMRLVDDRSGSQRMWYKLMVPVDLSRQQKSVSLTFRPNIQPGWKKPPMIAISQVGYHPGQQKRAIIELARGTEKAETTRLKKLDVDGVFQEIKSDVPQIWGDYLRCTYAVFDFSEIEAPGLYAIEYGDKRTHLFKIAGDVYRNGVWQPVLETFVPVQMCHVSVRDRIRLWHAACHLDDALQAPAPLPFFDGFKQSEKTETNFEPKTTIPGLNVGGWHDAGDDDINTGSSGRTTYHLALAIEEFGLNSDQTTIDFDRREVHLHQPDGISDALQQVIHGVHWLLAQYRQIDHSIVGVISSNWDTYLQTADWGVFTDNLFYHAEMKPEAKDGKYSGKFDDRYAFTNKDTSREYLVAAIFSASSRVLKDHAKNLADTCLTYARKIWDYEENHAPVTNPSVGRPRNLIAERTDAAVELFLTTGEPKFLNAILAKEAETLNEIRHTGWTISRVIDQMNNKTFKKNFEQRLQAYRQSQTTRLNATPFGVIADWQVWGIAWNILWRAQQQYFLIKKYPQLFSKEELLAAVNYTLGVHPGSNTSLVSSVGTHRPIPAFGINRHDYSHIPGGVYSGTGLILPDFPELKDDHPFLWQQSEYMIFGATPFIFCVLAADKLLNEN
ncbi:glycoside hydrolase family 9 protein [candidate division KSB1 bacterium]|nr:glycoside hydrolase family 9 protein [candidate division KSB1 bacterium]